MAALELFHPLIKKWFLENYTHPTDIQEQSWPEIAEGRHVLITAPTGSGKTLTAFLWAINLLAERGRSGERAGFAAAETENSGRILYISPLKALNNDIERNLRDPMVRLREFFARHGVSFPAVTIGVRSGDTPQTERRRMEKSPPRIFITTPESLHILLSSKGGRKQLIGFSTVILDEIHALAATKRGAFLMSAVERLTDYSGEFQRIGLSATLRPLSLIAEFIGGYRPRGAKDSSQYELRPVTVVKTSEKKHYALTVDVPKEPEENTKKDWWTILSKHYLDIIREHNSTLLFANSRRMVEKLSRFINDEAEKRIVYAHHGSLSKEIRLAVEQRLKQGELAGIVATGSLELGIDIGAIDAVVLVQTPFSVAQTLQRIGRSGHKVGEVSKGIFLPIHTGDLLPAAVSVRSVLEETIEEIRPVSNPLDVLAQIILSMCLYEPRNLEEIYVKVKQSWNFRSLDKQDFNLVIEMLAGRYAGTRVRELQPRVYYDKVNNTILAKKNVPMLLFMSGGVIPDRGYYTLRTADSKARIGELDEEFVWERSLGDSFPFGNKIWRIQRITHNDVEVLPVERGNSVIPFWRADEQNRPYHFSEKICAFLDEAGEHIGKPDNYKKKIISRYFLTDHAADKLIEFLGRQKEATGTLPGRKRIVVEHFNDPLNRSDSKQTIIHTFWGGRINRPYAFSISAAWEEHFGYPLEVFANNDCILLNLPHLFSVEELIGLFPPEDLPRLLRKRLESTGYFGGKFRENAQRALLLPRKNFTQRMPLWLNRLRAKRLLETVKTTEDFPIVLETWRECLTEDFDLGNLARLIGELQTGDISVAEAYTTVPSPFAENIIWRQTNYYMYEDDTPGGRLNTNLSDELIRKLLDSPEFIPDIPDDIIRELTKKLQRTAAGYAPDSPEELLQHLRDRVLIPADEWKDLLLAIERETGGGAEEILGPIRDRIITIDSAGGSVALEEERWKIEPLFAAAGKTVSEDPADENEYTMFRFLSEWLSFYGPITAERLLEKLRGHFESSSTKVAASPGNRQRELIEQGIRECIDEEVLVIGRFSETCRNTADTTELCDRKNLETLLRLRRARQRPTFATREIEELQYFLATFQGITFKEEGLENFQEKVEQLFGFPLSAALWESEALPCRCNPYYSQWMDTAFIDSGLMWFGCGKEKVGLCFTEDIELFFGPKHPRRSTPTDKDRTAAEVLELLVKQSGKVSFSFIAAELARPGSEITESLWELAWQGLITNDTFAALRRGIAHKFSSHPAPTVRDTDNRRRPSRFSSNRWVRTLPLTGNWYAVRSPRQTNDKDMEDPASPLETEELNKDRVRQLLLRYGLLFRELLQHELPDFQWKNLFRTLRLMELSGEITSGHFFNGIPGLQFISPRGLRILSTLFRDTDTRDDSTASLPIYWMNAQDPASLCGKGIEELKGILPPRLPATHIVYRGAEVVLVSKRFGKELEFTVEPDDPDIPEFCGVFDHLVTREAGPLTAVKTEGVNGMPAADSPYAEALITAGFTKDYKILRFRKRY